MAILGKLLKKTIDLNVVKNYTIQLDTKLYLWSVNYDYYN